MKTLSEIEILKQNWINDPIWDIECTEGYEEYHDELKAFSDKMKAKWEFEYNERLRIKAEQIGVPGNIKLANEIIRLERLIESIEEKIER